jgi:D-3-phosphoglycerate dehydrogenase
MDVAAATELGIAIAEGVGSPTAPAELTWALIMAAAQDRAVCQQPQGRAVADGLRQPAAQRAGQVLKGRTLGIWGYGKIGQLAGYGRAFGMQVLVWGSEAAAPRPWRTAIRQPPRARRSSNRPMC